MDSFSGDGPGDIDGEKEYPYDGYDEFGYDGPQGIDDDLASVASVDVDDDLGDEPNPQDAQKSGRHYFAAEPYISSDEWMEIEKAFDWGKPKNKKAANPQEGM
mmetsp:Transcript_35390/g.101735  ORF Transcript_35390/g.101735 Transcript_35390/m.101735 type:complete len:103 (-) Transcript_35390:189-497(-)